jgi:hypothetical protein
MACMIFEIIVEIVSINNERCPLFKSMCGCWVGCFKVMTYGDVIVGAGHHNMDAKKQNSFVTTNFDKIKLIFTNLTPLLSQKQPV